MHPASANDYPPDLFRQIAPPLRSGQRRGTSHGRLGPRPRWAGSPRWQLRWRRTSCQEASKPKMAKEEISIQNHSNEHV